MKGEINMSNFWKMYEEVKAHERANQPQPTTVLKKPEPKDPESPQSIKQAEHSEIDVEDAPEVEEVQSEGEKEDGTTSNTDL